MFLWRCQTIPNDQNTVSVMHVHATVYILFAASLRSLLSLHALCRDTADVFLDILSRLY